MEMAPEELLAGPRGRRLCLEAAGQDLTPEVLHAALSASVDAAGYWQEPDEQDRAGALPAARTALEPIAHQVLASPVAREWTRPRPAEQWVIDWRDEDDSAPITRTTPERLAVWERHVREDEARAARERPSDPTANWSGEWWSTPVDAAHTVSRVPEALDLLEDSFGWETATLIPVRGVGRTYEIRTPQDWTRLCHDHPLDVTASRRHDWYRVTGRDGTWVIPDWEQVARHWDAVHLTTAAYLSAATRELPVDGERSSMIAGWDPDTTYWLTDSLREWDGPRQLWRRDEDTGRWVTSGPGHCCAGAAGSSPR